jgi:hypothetical protein
MFASRRVFRHDAARDSRVKKTFCASNAASTAWTFVDAVYLVAAGIIWLN